MFVSCLLAIALFILKVWNTKMSCSFMNSVCKSNKHRVPTPSLNTTSVVRGNNVLKWVQLSTAFVIFAPTVQVLVYYTK